jgi:molybdopterin synthase catalytic subunit/molybdopterin converting factor small subunit
VGGAEPATGYLALMLITVRLFAMLRERAGAGKLELELPDGACVADALEAVGDLAEGLPLVMAVNRRYADADVPLSAGDELALIPPVSGGAEDPAAAAGEIALHVRLRSEPLSLDFLVSAVRDPRAGAVVSFQGVTREVERLDYEAYAEMAVERMREIADAARARHDLCRVAVEHRIGSVPLSEPSVVVAVSAPHRAEAFAGAREIIDALKAQVPIWKREIDGEVAAWVPGNRPTS